MIFSLYERFYHNTVSAAYAACQMGITEQQFLTRFLDWVIANNLLY
jgi:hypothetical protein